MDVVGIDQSHEQLDDPCISTSIYLSNCKLLPSERYSVYRQFIHYE